MYNHSKAINFFTALPLKNGAHFHAFTCEYEENCPNVSSRKYMGLPISTSTTR